VSTVKCHFDGFENERPNGYSVTYPLMSKCMNYHMIMRPSLVDFLPGARTQILAPKS
jgi:hypothetical protein